MAMDFWKAQEKAKSRTVLYLLVFFCMTLFLALGIEWILRTFLSDYYTMNFPLFAVCFSLITITYAAFNYLMYREYGGKYVAESLGARKISLTSNYAEEKKLINIVEEISIAASLPMPAIYILDAKEINAFAAGLDPNKSAITVTQGSLNQLNREELQGVIAHEFGHIYNGDMKIGLQLSALVAGFFIALYLGFRLLQFSNFRSREDKRNPLLLLGLALLAAGSIAWLGGSILRSMVSREREYLADATGVQFTRNPQGLIGALKKIGASTKEDMPKVGKPYAHLYFNHKSFMETLFATHPSLEKRIAALEGETYFPKKAPEES